MDGKREKWRLNTISNNFDIVSSTKAKIKKRNTERGLTRSRKGLTRSRRLKQRNKDKDRKIIN